MEVEVEVKRCGRGRVVDVVGLSVAVVINSVEGVDGLGGEERMCEV